MPGLIDAHAHDNWGTYVAVHGYTPKAVRRSIAAGVRCIEHGNLLDDDTAKMMADKGVWWCLQPFLDDEDATPFPEGSKNRRKQLTMFAGTDTAYDLARKYKIKTAWGTDTLFDAKGGSAGRAAGQDDALIQALGSAEDGDIRQCSSSGNVGPPQPLFGPARRGEGTGAGRSAPDRRRPSCRHRHRRELVKYMMVIMKDGKLYKSAPA